MKKIASVIVLLLSMSSLSGCTSDPESTGGGIDDYEEFTSDELTQNPSTILVYSEGEEKMNIESCPFFDRYSTVEQPTQFRAAFPRPGNLLNTDGQFEVYGDGDFSGHWVILDSQSVSGYIPDWFYFIQSKNPLGVIYSDSTQKYINCSDIIYYKAKDSDLKNTISNREITIPILMISPIDLRELQRIDNNPILVIGPKGFESSNGIIDQTDDAVVNILPIETFIQFEEEHESCQNEDEVMKIETTKRDSNGNGEYDIDEIVITKQCVDQSEMDRSTYNQTLETMSVVPREECASGSALVPVITRILNDGRIEAEQLDDQWTCTGMTTTQLEQHIYRMFCEDVEQENRGEVTIVTCTQLMIEEELRRVVPQMEIEKLTNEQLPQCQNGGLRIMMWADTDLNGNVDSSEVLSLEALCNGLDGIDGLDAFELLTLQNSASIEQCESGGSEVAFGRDVNENMLLDPNEVEHQYVTCNGIDGQDGSNSMVNITSFNSSQCDGIYVKLSNGYDVNNDSSLDQSEISGFRYVCLPSRQTQTNATFVKEQILPNQECLNGGIHTYIWLDEDTDNETDEDEIFMETFDCSDDREQVECNDADQDCISDGDDANPGYDDRQDSRDSDGDGVLNEDDICEGGDDRIDSDGDGTPDECDDDV